MLAEHSHSSEKSLPINLDTGVTLMKTQSPDRSNERLEGIGKRISPRRTARMSVPPILSSQRFSFQIPSTFVDKSESTENEEEDNDEEDEENEEKEKEEEEDEEEEENEEEEEKKDEKEEEKEEGEEDSTAQSEYLPENAYQGHTPTSSGESRICPICETDSSIPDD